VQPARLGPQVLVGPVHQRGQLLDLPGVVAQPRVQGGQHVPLDARQLGGELLAHRHQHVVLLGDLLVELVDAAHERGRLVLALPARVQLQRPHHDAQHHQDDGRHGTPRGRSSLSERVLIATITYDLRSHVRTGTYVTD
jgi:hypothetical protein